MAESTDVRPTRSERKAELRARIISESLALFLEQGYDQTTMRQIIHKTGILNGSLYNVFKSKDEIYSAVLMEALAQSTEQEKVILGDDADLMSKVTFPFILEIYSSNRSKKIASLLSVGFERATVRRSIIDFSVKNLMQVPDVSGMFTEDEVRFRVEMGMGALGSVISMYANGSTNIPLQEAIDLVSGLMVSMFCDKVEGLSERNARILELIENSEVVICGIKI